jgi:hypothetical protein
MTPRLHEADRIDGLGATGSGSSPLVECGAKPAGVDRPGVVVEGEQGVEEPDQVTAPGRVRGGLPGCVPGQDGDGLIEPLPLVFADKSVERGCDRGIGWVEPVRGGLAGGCGMGGERGRFPCVAGRRA